MRLYYGRDDTVRIYHGRWQEVADHLGLGPANVALVLADPPYGVNENTKRATAGRRGDDSKAHGGRHAPIDWPAVHGDDQAFDPTAWLAYPKTILWGANHYAGSLPSSPSWLVWDKRQGGTSDDNADCELAWSNLGGPARLFHYLWRGMVKAPGAVSASREVIQHLHPTQKPIALMEWCLGWAKLVPGDLVFVPYMGSGPEVRACLNLGYRVVAAEVEERYCEAAVKYRVMQEAMPLWS